MGIERVAGSHSPLTITSHKARVVGDPRRAAVITRLPTPAQEGGAARRDRAQRHRLDPREPMRAAIGVAMRTHEVGEGEAKGRDRGRRLDSDGTHGLRL